jgi:hypothetical protein
MVRCTYIFGACEAVGVAIVRSDMSLLVLCDVEYGTVVQLTIAYIHCQLDCLNVLQLA